MKPLHFCTYFKYLSIVSFKVKVLTHFAVKRVAIAYKYT